MLVAIAEALSPVIKVIPELASTHQKRRYIITPRMVSTLGV